MRTLTILVHQESITLGGHRICGGQIDGLDRNRTCGTGQMPCTAMDRCRQAQDRMVYRRLAWCVASGSVPVN